MRRASTAFSFENTVTLYKPSPERKLLIGERVLPIATLPNRDV
jgi:hypothetical protein